MGTSTTDKYLDREFPIAFSVLMSVVPLDAMSGATVISASVSPTIIWAKDASTNAKARFVSAQSFNGSGVGLFGYVAFGY